MLVPRLGALIAVGCCAALAGAGTALATTIPAPSVLATDLAAGASSGDIQITTRGPVEVTFREITIEPGGSTGWHHHAGELLAVVQAGALSRQFEDCTEVTTPAGQAFVEPAGGEHVHVGRNLGTEPVVLYVAYVLPAGSPFAEEAPDPGCGP